ncbi:MAG TPA: response regulator transcription factor [Candidatus Sulfotelmatobacter sp.]
MSVPRILLVDDTPEVLALCAEILKRSYEIAGTAGDGESAISAVEMTAPDVVVLDITMPRLNGVEVAKRLRSSGYGGAIVFLSGDLELMNSAMEAGGSAFVTKTRLSEDLMVAIREALAGRAFVSFSE